MADFFSVLGKKISDVAEDLEKKTEDTLEVQKIKSNIRSLKRANERDFMDIGKMVYEKFHDGEMSDYVPTDEELAIYRAKLPKID